MDNFMIAWFVCYYIHFSSIATPCASSKLNIGTYEKPLICIPFRD